MTKPEFRKNDEARMTKGRLFGFRHSDLIRVSGFVILICAGCSSSKQATTRPASAYDRQQAAMRDPFGYNPNVEKASDISGGDINHLDRNAMKKDINDVLNP
jgi:hypothetical protein